MFFRKKQHALNTESLASLIDHTVTINGSITFDKNARIDGTVYGNLTGSMAKNNLLIVGPQATVHGDIRCQSLVVLGYVKGNVTATYLEIRSSARIHGDACYETIEMYQGAEINGHLFRIQSDSKKETSDTPSITLEIKSTS